MVCLLTFTLPFLCGDFFRRDDKCVKFPLSFLYKIDDFKSNLFKKG